MTVEPAALLLGRYEVSRIVAQGSMGSLYLGVDQRAGRRVAIKTVRFDPLMTEDERVQLRGWFAREVKALKLIQHAHILQLIDYDEFEEEPYSITEWLDGADLAVLLDHAGKFPGDAVAAIGEQIASALAAAHHANVIHRDVKPSNIVLTPQGRAVLLDFGLARGMKSRATDTLALSFGTGMVGTPHFLAPEVVAGDPAGLPADVFALGGSLYMLATKTPPFEGTNPLLVLDSIRQNNRRPLGEMRPDLPDALIATIESMMHPDPDHRPTAETAHTRLRRVLDVSSSVSVLAEFAIRALVPTEAKTAELHLTAPRPSAPVDTDRADLTQPGFRVQPLPEPISSLAPDDASNTQKEILTPDLSDGPNTQILTLTPSHTEIMTVTPRGDETALHTSPTTGEAEVDTESKVVPVLVTLLAIAAIGTATFAFLKPRGPAKRPGVTDRTQAENPIDLPPPSAEEPPKVVVAPPPSEPAPAPQPPVAKQQKANPPSSQQEQKKAAAEKPSVEAKRATIVIALAIWANVEVDGLDMGNFQSAFRTELDPGPHKIVLSHPKYGERRLDVRLKGGDTTTLRVDLKQEGGK